MKQLALPVSLPAHAVFDTFISNGNEALVVQLKDLSAKPNIGETLFISGKQGSGKTHLAQAICHESCESAQAVYLNLANPNYTYEVLEGWDNSQLICLDNIDVVQGENNWEEALFDLFNRRLERAEGQKSSLLMTASKPLSELNLRLPDLRSRLSSGLIFQITELAERHLSLALTAHAHQRGFEIPTDTMKFLMSRLPRELSELMSWLDKTDKASLEAQRKLTIPFVKELLD